MPRVQMVNAYQPANQLYCVRALYVPTDPSNLNVSCETAACFRHGMIAQDAGWCPINRPVLAPMHAESDT